MPASLTSQLNCITLFLPDPMDAQNILLNGEENYISRKKIKENNNIEDREVL